MNAPIATVGEADINAAAVADLKRVITKHIADTLTGTPRINGHFIKITTVVHDDWSVSADLTTADAGIIAADLTRWRFGGDDCAVRITLTVGDPVAIPPADLPNDISPRTTALLELWAADNTDPVTNGGGAA